jgi:hypothetical protein
MKISYIILAHQQPKLLERLVGALIGAGHTVAIHYDRKADKSGYRQVVARFAGNPSVRFAKRVKVSWGKWSIVQATLNCIEEIAAAGWEPDYVYYASGADYPIRSSEELKTFLQRNRGKEFIEGVPSDRERWVKGGPQEERYQYRFWINWRDNPTLAPFLLDVQKKLKLKRRFVLGLEPYMGSQWWVLTWKTLQKILTLAHRHDVRSFFKTVLIPDELFFQTLVYNLVPHTRIIAAPLTLYQFTDYLVPLIYCADRVEYLVRQPFFMARKMSAHRMEMFDALDAVWLGQTKCAPFEDCRAGVVSSEYEEHRLRLRDGAPGHAVYGKQPDKWAEHLAWLDQKYFGVLGTSTAELKLAHLLISCASGLICHGQIFHPNCIEFAYGAHNFAGYTTDKVTLRNDSAPNFVADLVLARPNRLTGFLLRSGQGWHVPEILFNRQTTRVLVLRGDPLIAFVESLRDTEPTSNERIDWNTVDTMPPSVLVRKWQEFLPNFEARLKRLDYFINQGIENKRSGNWDWLTEVDLDTSGPSRLHRQNVVRMRSDLAGWSGITLGRLRDFIAHAGRNLGTPLSSSITAETWREVTTTLVGLEEGRRLTMGVLASGGITLPQGYDPADLDVPVSFGKAG